MSSSPDWIEKLARRKLGGCVFLGSIFLSIVIMIAHLS